MTVNLGVVMDPIGTITPYKDSTLAMLLAAQHRGWRLHYMEPADLYMRDGEARAATRSLTVHDDNTHWYQLSAADDRSLAELDCVLMRKDPPFDMRYVYATYTLERAQAAGTLVVNDPRALRDINEKLAILRYPQCCAPTLVSAAPDRLRAFVAEQQDAVVKPLDKMGGDEVYRVTPEDVNLTVILDHLTQQGREPVMAQRFIPDIVAGDKRILLVDGEPVPYALARIPRTGEFRGNLAAGGRGEAVPLTERDRWIAEQTGPTLAAMGLLFVGLDVIGQYLTEINVTSPTCIRELDAQCGLDIGGSLMSRIAERLEHGKGGQ